MKRVLYLNSPLPPSVNDYLQYRVVRVGRKMSVQPFPTEYTKKYQRKFFDIVKTQIELQGWSTPPKGKYVVVECVMYLNKKRKDPNNFLKVPFDVMTKAGVYIDDDIALPVVTRVFIDAKNPRLEFTIYEADSIGIFDDFEELDTFEIMNCDHCKKPKEKCSIYKSALDNKLNFDNIDLENLKCKKIKLKKGELI